MLHQTEAQKKLFNLLQNICVYFTSIKSNPNSYTKSSKFHPRRYKVGPATTWTIGKDYKISPQLREYALDQGRINKTFKIKHKFVVRGHWRNQARGTGMTDRRLKWIEPYWKGPDGADGLLRKIEAKVARLT